MGLGSTSLDAQPHGVTRRSNILSNQTSRNGESQLLHTANADMGRNISLPATSLPRYHRRNMKQTAHNNVAKVFGNQGKNINPEKRHAQWDRKVHTFLTHSANANNFKVSNHSTRSLKRKLDELPEPLDVATLSQRPQRPV
jgi:hypothetical protein